MPSESKLALRRSKKLSAKQKLSAKPKLKQKLKREFKQKQLLAQEKLSWLSSEQLKRQPSAQQQIVLVKLQRLAGQRMSVVKQRFLSSSVRLKSVLAKSQPSKLQRKRQGSRLHGKKRLVGNKWQRWPPAKNSSAKQRLKPEQQLKPSSGVRLQKRQRGSRLLRMQRDAQRQSVLNKLLKPELLNSAEQQHQQHGLLR